MLKRYWLLLVITSFICCSTSTITVKALTPQSIRDVCVLKYQRITKHYVEDGILFVIGYLFAYLSFIYLLYICSMTIMGWIATLGLSQEFLSVIGLFLGVAAVIATAAAEESAAEAVAEIAAVVSAVIIAAAA